jgi:hypothetical protein
MANYSSETRREQVLSKLKEHANEWVDGPELANAEVGGSEGLKRVRELRAEGHTIQTRKHPDKNRDIYQYRLVLPVISEAPAVPPLRIERAPEQITMLPVPIDELNRFTDMPRGLAFGQAVMCHRCKAQTRRIAKGMQTIPLFRDPDDGKEFCKGCNGWGIVPVVAAR